jgi:hypothetical protein
MDEMLELLSHIPPSGRILLLPHCLRQSKTCEATYNEEGLQCAECNVACSINRLRIAALEFGYKGVCVAPGGKLAIKYVKEKQPAAVIAVACDKELADGVRAIKGLGNGLNIVIIVIPLRKDGCVDTVVDDEEALKAISSGCITSIAGVNYGQNS